MPPAEPLTLKEIQLRLGVPSHVLIHLCEKGVIQPDLADTSGRGKRREFSQRNVFEFALALALRKFELPVTTAALMLRLLRGFQGVVAKLVPRFELTGFLLANKGVLNLHLDEGQLLFFSAQGGGLAKPLLLAADLSDVTKSGTPRVKKLNQLPEEFEVRLTINLNQIAENALK